VGVVATAEEEALATSSRSTPTSKKEGLATRTKARGAATTPIRKAALRRDPRAAEGEEGAEGASTKGKTVALIITTQDSRKISMTGIIPSRAPGTLQ